MSHRSTVPHRITAQRAHSQHNPTPSRLDTSGIVIRDDMNPTILLPGKLNEKELMHGLNSRLAGFIEKVHQLEEHNHLLEREIREIRGKATSASHLEDDYGPELRKLRQLVLDITQQKHQIELEHQNLEEELCNLRSQYEQEARSRSEAESSIAVLKKDVTDAYLAKLQLDKKAQSLVDEIHFLKKNHEAEVAEMFNQIQDAEVTVRAHEFGHPSITAALRDIRAQLEGHSAPDVRHMGETFRSQFARLTVAAETKREALKASQQEIQEHRRLLQAKTVELDCAKGTREAMEKQLHEVEDQHKEEIIHYQNTIKELENELINCKFDMSGYLREYQDLLNVKMALDVEILSYRKLLCGEEARLSTMSDTHMSLPYIYHQSPIYALPCHSRPGGPHRRVEPHYKFVEEIITETTREIEMSEFEETGSEETDMGKEEQECSKRERRGSKEEKDNKDSGEEEGNQMSDSQRDQVALVGNLVNGSEDMGGESPDEVDKSKKESEEAEVADDDDSSKDKNIKSLDDEEKQQHQVAPKREDEKEAAVMTVQTNPSSKPHDLKPEVPVEPELLRKSEDGKQVNAEEHSFISAVAKKTVDETSGQVSEELDKIPELNPTVQVPDTVHTWVSETTERTTNFTEEMKSSQLVKPDTFSEKPQVTSSSKSKNEGKENSHKETKETGQSDDAIAEKKVAKKSQDVNHESNKDQDKESFLKYAMKQLPEVEAPQPNSRDETQTVLPKETTAEVKASHQGAPESIQGQKPKLSEDSKNK